MAGIRGEAKLSVGMERTNRQQEQEEKQPEVEATEDSPRRQRNESVLINHAIHEIKHRPLEVPTIIGDDPVYTMDKQQVPCPHHLKTNLAHVFYANRKQIETAIRSALSTQGTWSLVPIAERLAIWRRAADIIQEDELRLRVFLIEK